LPSNLERRSDSSEQIKEELDEIKEAEELIRFCEELGLPCEWEKTRLKEWKRDFIRRRRNPS